MLRTWVGSKEHLSRLSTHSVQPPEPAEVLEQMGAQQQQPAALTMHGGSSSSHASCRPWSLQNNMNPAFPLCIY